jgi:hypothetical protein
MEKINTGGPAFPRTGSADISGYGVPDQEGMTIRDYFAAKAMQTILETDGGKANEAIASLSYIMADAMLRAREA